MAHAEERSSPRIFLLDDDQIFQMLCVADFLLTLRNFESNLSMSDINDCGFIVLMQREELH